MPKKALTQPTEEEMVEKMAEALLYEWWYAIAEEIFERVCRVTDLDEEQKDALRTVALRPNDFQIEMEEKTES